MNIISNKNLFKIPEIPKSFIIKAYVNGVSSRRNFTKEEDARLSYLVQMFGTKDWNLISNMMPFRNARQCKDRFKNYLSPQINLKPWTKEEDLLLIQKVKELGPKWVQISQYFEGRSDNNLKNRWYTHLKQKFEESNKIENKKSIIEQNKIEICDDFDYACLNSDLFLLDLEQMFVDTI